MMERAEALLLDAGCPKINLQVTANNRKAAAFCRRVGYLEDPV